VCSRFGIQTRQPTFVLPVHVGKEQCGAIYGDRGEDRGGLDWRRRFITEGFGDLLEKCVMESRVIGDGLLPCCLPTDGLVSPAHRHQLAKGFALDILPGYGARR
jgi:hypothetical protein